MINFSKSRLNRTMKAGHALQKKNKQVWWALPFSLLLICHASSSELTKTSANVTTNVMAGPTTKINLESSLTACVHLTKPIIYTAEGILFAKISYSQKKSIAECGCKSANSHFTSLGSHKENTIFLMKGEIMFNQTGTMNLPLALNQTSSPLKNIKLYISCAEQG